MKYRAKEIARESTFLKDWDSYVPNPWVPVVDGEYADEAFMPESPLTLMKKGSFNKMPLIIGQARDEGTVTNHLVELRFLNTCSYKDFR